MARLGMEGFSGRAEHGMLPRIAETLRHMALAHGEGHQGVPGQLEAADAAEVVPERRIPPTTTALVVRLGHGALVSFPNTRSRLD